MTYFVAGDDHKTDTVGTDLRDAIAIFSAKVARGETYVTLEYMDERPRGNDRTRREHRANIVAALGPIEEMDERLLWLLRKAGEEWGPRGVALAAARLMEGK